MKQHMIRGSGGTRLHVEETGNATGRAILFLHGFSQCWLAWSRQLNSDLADDYHLVAMDLRGHGLSDKPREHYDDSTVWAEDIDSVIRTLELDHPILCAWSYGLVPLDYIRHRGEAGIGGLVLVGAITKIGTEEAMSVIAPGFAELIPGFFAGDVEEGVRSLRALIRMCSVGEPAAEEAYLMLGYNVSVPPHVRQALFSRQVDNDDLLGRIRKPVMIVHGSDDAVVRPVVVEQHRRLMAHAAVRMMANTGHAPFREDAETFNRHLREFAESL